MRTLTIRERDQISVGDNVIGLNEAEAGALERLASVLPPGAVAWGHRKVSLGPFCGVLRLGKLVVEVLPKVGVESAGTDQARGVLIAMLRASGGLAETEVGSAPLDVQKLHLLDVFILDFCRRVNALLRRGLVHSYQLFEEELPTIRGRLRLGEHLRRSAANRARIFCRFDEFTADNPHNRALKSVLSLLLQHALGLEAKGALTGLLRRMEDVAFVPCRATDIDRLRFDRLTDAWRPVFERAAWFLRGLFPYVRAGKIDGACLMFNMEHLFEAFVAAKLRRCWHGLNVVGPRLVLQGPHAHLAVAGMTPAFQLRPDASVVSDAGMVERLYDTKWKQLNPKNANLGVDHVDVYQLGTYAGHYGCTVAAILYPRSALLPEGLVGTFKLRLPGSPRIEIYALDLIDLATGGAVPVALGP